MQDPYISSPDHPDPEEPQRPSQLLARLIQWLRSQWEALSRPWRMAGPLPLPLPQEWCLHDGPDLFELTTPAKGDAFSFEISVRCDWCVKVVGSDPEAVEAARALMARHRAGIRERVENLIRPIVREYPPHRPAEAEQAIQSDRVICFDDGNVQCHVRARVEVTEQIRDALREMWMARLGLDADRANGEALVEHLRVLRALWRDFLREGLEDWITPYALALAEGPTDVAGQHKLMVQERRREAEDLLGAVGGVVQAHQSLDAFDFVVRSDSALRRIMELLGVRVPDNGSTTAFEATEWNEADVAGRPPAKQ